MDWTLILSSSETDEAPATEGRFIELVSLMNQTQLVGMSMRLLAALGADRGNRLRTVGAWLESIADKKTLGALAAQRAAADTGVTFELAESWQQWLIIRAAIRHSPATGGLDFTSAEGIAVFFELCRCAYSLSSPPTPPITGDLESDVLKAAAAVIPRMWLHNPPHLNNAVGRMIFFLKSLPDLVPSVREHADSLRERFETDLGVPFEEARDMIAFLGYAAAAIKVEDVLKDPASSLLDPNTWLSQTNLPDELWQRLRARISTPIERIDEPVPGEGSRWFDPLGLRNRPLIDLPNERVLIAVPSLLAEKASFEMFWWLTEGPGGAAQRNAWQASFGKLCEQYVIWMLQGIAVKTETTLNPNVAWHDGDSQGEIDCLYARGDKLIVVEISGSFVNNAAKMSGDWERLRTGVETAFVERGTGPGAQKEAVAQLDRDIRWLLEQRTNNSPVAGIDLRTIQTVYPVIVAPDRMVRTQGIGRYLDRRLTQRLPDAQPWSVAPLAVFGLEDLESVHELIIRGDERFSGSLPPFFQIMRRWDFDHSRYPAFWQFLDDWLAHEHPTQHLKDLSDAWFKGIAERFKK